MKWDIEFSQARVWAKQLLALLGQLSLLSDVTSSQLSREALQLPGGAQGDTDWSLVALLIPRAHWSGQGETGQQHRERSGRGRGFHVDLSGLVLAAEWKNQDYVVLLCFLEFS